MIRVTLIAALLVTAAPAMAQQAKSAQPVQKSHAELVQECMSDIQKGLKVGQTMTSHQRMQAEQQCRAFADSKK